MKIWHLFFIFLSIARSPARSAQTATTSADLRLNPRYEYIYGKKELASQLILKATLNSNIDPFLFYIEGFGETDANHEQSEIRRTPTRAYLQEAYAEFKKNEFYLRIGKQAIRWSEMWTTPSLDIWTGHRWNRLYYDPLPEQLEHSSGGLFSYANQDWSADVVVIQELANSYYPEPLPEKNQLTQKTSFGSRIKFKLAESNVGILAAQVINKKIYGINANYAFDYAVPKLEIGKTNDVSKDASKDAVNNIKSEDFINIGTDIFIGNWIFLPQINFVQNRKIAADSTNFEKTYYISTQWVPSKQDFQLQLYRNETQKDSFASVSYTYNWTNYFSTAIFAQNYEGQNEDLYNTFKNITGGNIIGMRVDFIEDFSFLEKEKKRKKPNM